MDVTDKTKDEKCLFFITVQREPKLSQALPGFTVRWNKRVRQPGQMNQYKENEPADASKSNLDTKGQRLPTNPFYPSSMLAYHWEREAISKEERLSLYLTKRES